MHRGLVVAVAAAAVAVTACTGNAAAPPDTAAPRPVNPAVVASPPAPRPTPSPAGSSAARRRGQLVWVAVEGGGRVVLVDLATGEVRRNVATRGGPHNITVAPDGTVVASLYGTTQLALITRHRTRTVELGDRPHDPKPMRDGFVVANEAGRRLDYVSLDGGAGPRVALRGEPHDVAVDPARRRAWATLNGSGDLAVVDLDTAEVDRYVPTGYAPHDLLFAPDGRLWVTDWNGRLLVIDSGEVVRTVPLGVEAHHLAFSPDGSHAWITDQGSREVFVLDARTLEVLDTIALKGAPHHVAISADGAYAAVADNTNGTLLVYDTSTRRRADVVEVGDGPHGVWAAPPG